MPPKLKKGFESEMRMAKALYYKGEWAGAFHHLERAHILGQRYVIPHVTAHWWMLKVGLRRRDAEEVRGQIMRLPLGAIGSALGHVPTGNTGGANVNMFARMPIEKRLQELLEDSPTEKLK